MTSPDNILLHLANDEEQQVRSIFAAMSKRGFPQQRQTPHITITFSPRMNNAAIERAAELLPPVIPAQFRRAGTVVFGTKGKQTIAWLLETSDEVEEAAREVSAANPDGRGKQWIPHLTMGLRIPRDLVGEYIMALDEETSSHFKNMTATKASLWRPSTQELTVFAQSEA